MWPDAPGMHTAHRSHARTSTYGLLAPANNLIASTSEDELRVLFDGLDRFPANFPTDLPADFPNSSLANAGGEFPASMGAWDLDVNAQGLGSFGMHQLHAAVDELQVHESPDQHSHVGLGLRSSGLWIDNYPAQPHAPVHHSPPFMPSRTPTPAQAVGPLLGVPSPSARHSLLSRPASRPTPVSRTGTPAGLLGLSHGAVFASPAPRSRTRDLVAQAREEARLLVEAQALAKARPDFLPPARSLLPPIAAPQPRSLDDINAGSLTLLRRPPLRRSLGLPSFLQDDEADKPLSDEDQSRPPTPVRFEDTDISSNEFSPPPVTQARA
jgi:hypothetical protein